VQFSVMCYENTGILSVFLCVKQPKKAYFHRHKFIRIDNQVLDKF